MTGAARGTRSRRGWPAAGWPHAYLQEPLGDPFGYEREEEQRLVDDEDARARLLLVRYTSSGLGGGVALHALCVHAVGTLATALAAGFPRVRVEASPIYVKDGAVYTSAGITASMDLALALLDEDHGRRVALQVAKELVPFSKRLAINRSSAYAARGSGRRGRALADTRERILANLARDLSVNRLARRLHMSTPNFSCAGFG